MRMEAKIGHRTALLLIKYPNLSACGPHKRAQSPVDSHTRVLQIRMPCFNWGPGERCIFCVQEYRCSFRCICWGRSACQTAQQAKEQTVEFLFMLFEFINITWHQSQIII